MERSPTSGKFTVRNVGLTHLLKVKEDQHLGVVEAIKEELSNVPTGSYRDKFYDFYKNIVKIWKKNWKL